MRVNKSEMNVAYDVDETLILHDVANYPGLSRIKVMYYGVPKIVAVHEKHVELLKAHKARGFHVRVWSNNGWLWAETIIKALGLTAYVDDVETKNSKFVDDLADANQVLGQHVYIKP